MRSSSSSEDDSTTAKSRSRFRRTLAAFGLLLGLVATSVATAPGALALQACDQPAHAYVTLNGVAYSSGNYGGTELGIPTITVSRSDVLGLGAAGVYPNGAVLWVFSVRQGGTGGGWWQWGYTAGGNCVANEFFTNVTMNGQHPEIGPGQYQISTTYAWNTPSYGETHFHPEVYINVV